MKTRKTAPSETNKYYIHTSHGGYNKCILIKGDSVLPNCVGYAYGRFMEIAGRTTCKLPMCNAEDWYNHKDDYKRGKTPKLGAVMCFSKGKTGTGSDGAGHVLIVEEIYKDGSILCSQSGYNCQRFWTTKFKKPYTKAGYKFQGFIYNPYVNEQKVHDKIVELAATKNYKYPSGKPTTKFKKALKENYPDRSSWSEPCKLGAACDVAVGTVMRDTILPKYPRGFEKQWDKVDEYKKLKVHKGKRAWNIIKKLGTGKTYVILYKKLNGGVHTVFYSQGYMYEASLGKSYFHRRKSLAKLKTLRKAVKVCEVV